MTSRKMKALVLYRLGLLILVQLIAGLPMMGWAEIGLTKGGMMPLIATTSDAFAPYGESAGTSSVGTAGQDLQGYNSSAGIVCGQTITEDTTLNEDLLCPPTVPAITIGAPNITLDLGGRTLQGSPSGIGVFAQDIEGIIIRNGTIEGFNDGVFIMNTRYATIENLTVKNLDVADPDHFIAGVHIDGSRDVVVKDSLFEFPSVAHKEGVHTYGSDVVVRNIEQRGGGVGVGFNFNQVCDPSHTPSNGVVLNSKFSGFYIAGVYAACSSQVWITGNDFTTAPGIGSGIQAEAPFFGAVSGLTVEGNFFHADAFGIEFRGVINSVISSNIIRASSAWGIAMRQSLGCFGNEPGWDCFYSTGNVIRDNTVLGNGTDLYHYEESRGNVWERNACETKQGADIPECTPTPTSLLILLKSGTGSGTIVSSPVGVDCGSSCFAFFSQGAFVALTAAPQPGSIFGGWSGSGCSGTGICTVTMDTAKAVSAAFILGSHMLSVGKAGTGTGTVTSSPPGITCGADCQESYSAGAGVTLTATADPGSTFSGWSGDCDVAGQAIMDTDKRCTATFTLTPALLPDLTGTWNPVSQSCRKGTCTLKGAVQVLNQGPVSAPTSRLRVVLSDDTVLDPSDTVLKESSIKKLKPGRGTTSKIKIKLPPGASAAGKYLFAVLDALSSVTEIDETNNAPMTGSVP